MQRKTIRTLTIAATGCLLALGISFCTLFLQRMNPSAEPIYIYIDQDDTTDSVRTKSRIGWRFDVYHSLMPFNPRTGRYKIDTGIRHFTFYRQLRNGIQTPIKLSIPTLRTTENLATYLGEKLMLDAEEIREAFQDSASCAEWGYTPTTLSALFLPNTYEVYWNTSLKSFMRRMQMEHKAFWNQARMEKAEKTGYTPTEIATLASIIDEETANNAEKPIIAGMYLNRLKRRIPLQADPTVKFALQDFGLKRIYQKHLKVKSPYNTYQNAGLPPGPIRIASIASIDAVLNHAEHSYLYMCAKEDFSGTHNFATTYSAHLRNARKYARALNARNIK